MEDSLSLSRRQLGDAVHPESISYTVVSTLVWAICGVVFILWGLRLWGYGTVTSITVLPAVIVVAWGLLLIMWHGRSSENSSTNQTILVITLLLSIVALALWSYAQVITAPAYGTDEMAFDQYAAHLWLHGINPYGKSMAAAFQRYQVSPDGYTWTLSGHAVTLLSYPAQSFLIYVPFMMLGWTTQVAVGVNVIAWAGALLALFFALPRHLRPLSIVLTSLSVYISYAIGGVTDALFVPFLILAAKQWDQYPHKRGWAALWSPLWFGMAMGIKQTPWIIWPFLLFGIAAESRQVSGSWSKGLIPAVRYGLISGVVFLLPNVPFILLGPTSWLKGIMAPLLSPTIPNGQGLITLSLFLHIGGGSLLAYTILSAVMLLGLWVIYMVTYPRFKSWVFIAPSIALFVATRSFGSYLVMLVPAAIVAWITTRRPTVDQWSLSAKWVSGAIFMVIGASTAVALSVPSPLAMSLVDVHTTGQLATVDQVVTKVTNRTNRSIHPHFTADMSGTFTAFWTRVSGPQTLKPHQSARYTLAAPNFYAQPALTGGFQIVAFTAGTKTISHSATYLPTTWHVALIPDAVNRPVLYGTPVTLRAEILNRMDQPVHAAGVPIYLGQVVYAQRGLQYGEAIINHGSSGETPVSATTNAQGKATFVIRDVQHEVDPVFFEANLVNNRSFYPYGYSQILPIRFASTRGGV